METDRLRVVASEWAQQHQLCIVRSGIDVYINAPSPEVFDRLPPLVRRDLVLVETDPPPEMGIFFVGQVRRARRLNLSQLAAILERVHLI